MPGIDLTAGKMNSIAVWSSAGKPATNSFQPSTDCARVNCTKNKKNVTANEIQNSFVINLLIKLV